MIETQDRSVDARAGRERDIEPGAYVCLSVSDTGTGMTPAVMAKAFEPFFTTKPIGSGTGLGLSMIYGFARQSGGQVRLHSVPGQGTTVTIYLPRDGHAAQPEAVPASLSDAPRATGAETVLVVDDEESIRMLVTETLGDLGYRAIEAADGPAALRALSGDRHVDLLVTDVGLPGMNGRQLADAIRSTRPGLKVLFITGYAENAVLNHGHLEAGMHVITKPFAMEALASRIREIITAAS
jgi:CheY-like chemotaxis protein